jgi:hypothetical protein
MDYRVVYFYLNYQLKSTPFGRTRQSFISGSNKRDKGEDLQAVNSLQGHLTEMKQEMFLSDLKIAIW